MEPSSIDTQDKVKNNKLLYTTLHTKTVLVFTSTKRNVHTESNWITYVMYTCKNYCMSLPLVSILARFTQSVHVFLLNPAWEENFGNFKYLQVYILHIQWRYPASRGYIFAVWAGMQKVASANNCSIFYHAWAKFIMRFASKINIMVCCQMVLVLQE